MSVFRTKNSSPAENASIADVSQVVAPVVRSNTKPVTEGNITYSGNAVDGLIIQTGLASSRPNKISTDAGGDIMDWWDIAQSHFFTVQITYL